MDTVKIRPLDPAETAAIECDSLDCIKPATQCREWKTGRMRAPAFWYLCDKCSDEVARLHKP